MDEAEFISAMQHWHPEILEKAGVAIEDPATILFIKISKVVGFVENPEGYLSMSEALADLYMFI